MDDKFRKIFPGPGPVQKFLGIMIDSRAHKCFLPQENIEVITQTMLPVLSQPRTSVRKAMSLQGLLTAAIPVVPWAQIHSHPLQLEILRVWDRSNSSLDQEFQLSENILVSIQWWMNRDNLTIGRAKNPDNRCQPLWVGSARRRPILPGPVEGRYKKESSNFKELYAILRALQVTRDILKESHIQILSDNSTAVAYLNKQGHTRNKDFMALSFKIFALAKYFFFINYCRSSKKGKKT